MRLTFWHEALDKIFDKHRQGALPEHPVIEELNYVSHLVNALCCMGCIVL